MLNSTQQCHKVITEFSTYIDVSKQLPELKRNDVLQ